MRWYTCTFSVGYEMGRGMISTAVRRWRVAKKKEVRRNGAIFVGAWPETSHRRSNERQDGRYYCRVRTVQREDVSDIESRNKLRRRGIK